MMVCLRLVAQVQVLIHCENGSDAEAPIYFFLISRVVGDGDDRVIFVYEWESYRTAPCSIERV